MNRHGAAGRAIRRALPQALAEALAASRRDTLATFAVFESALADAGLRVPQRTELNPPLWELGHIGWFQAYWIGRNPQRWRGVAADADVPRAPGGDHWYDSSHVSHAVRASLPLPHADATRSQLEAQLAETLALLKDTADDDASLYFWRLALMHEDMHHEAALYSAQHLGLLVTDARWQPAPLSGPRHALALHPATWQLGNREAGFAFDNELGAHEVALPACEIDSRVVSWGEFLSFVEAGGYTDARWWSEAGQRWQAAQTQSAPRYLRREGNAWQQLRFGRWLPLDASLPACHVNAHEAEAWCAWAGRRLPSEAEWERAALERDADFLWGEVWEWTANAFTPYPGFTPHPYRDYSQPWFGSRRVLRGASFGTQPRLHHPRYRNFFPPERNDIFAGFRSCAR